MRRALFADPRILARATHYVWCAPLMHALMPRPLARRFIARIGPDCYFTHEGQAA